jgi:uncharacterized protein YbjT (DUF2867 family)
MTILVTGATGTVGRTAVQQLLTDWAPGAVEAFG